ncbi:hypothetical protein GUITHDRAFT_107324 [Guillardia theta CCMP2712]|uniref:Uncharacterized protein n=1 Tax=Guillardia theta (strain CCMP2712) TaxID=905079 RepID=L1JEQ8_GUITC|nr:hypothetical protein GUITHDRAFT_107324 [Guillardia theta CCMP2712]EKX46976.1 hypothetical protein GUITHDRAFT_107324 [Guillardia theta CCMP2712]|eukprot:XP_005833956.1 hypothetical protein GUITHDRAFT_107324 [Guillardia theta CCMP2712]
MVHIQHKDIHMPLDTISMRSCHHHYTNHLDMELVHWRNFDTYSQPDTRCTLKGLLWNIFLAGMEKVTLLQWDIRILQGKENMCCDPVARTFLVDMGQSCWNSSADRRNPKGKRRKM